MDFIAEEVVANKPINDDESLYSQAQLLALQTTGIISALLSLIGSSLIIKDIMKPSKRKRNLKSVYKRLVLGLSILDVLVDIGHYIIFGPFFSVPKEVDFVFAPQGNWATCEISGFFGMYFSGIIVYSAFLALYFALLLEFGMTEEAMKRYLEPLMHIVAVAYPTITGVIVVHKGYINPMQTLPGSRWLYEYPPDCNLPDSKVECIRGEDVNVVALFSMTVIMVLSFITNIICFTIVVRKVNHTETRSMRYLPSTLARGNRRTKRTAIQALLYISAFIITYTPLVVIQVIHVIFQVPRTKENSSLYFGLAFIAKLFPPLQGVFSCLIFFYRKQGPRRSSRQITGRRLFGVIATRSVSVENGRNTSSNKSAISEKHETVISYARSNTKHSRNPK